MKGVIHIHTKNSIDGANTIDGIYQWCKDNAIGFIAVTDHDQMAASVEFQQKYGEEILSITGAEYSTTIGHLLILFLTVGLENLLSRNDKGLFDVEEVLREARKQGALIIAAHPNKIEDKYLQQMDGLEVFNGRVLDPMRNLSVLSLAQKNGLRMFGGADAHLPVELNHCLLEVAGNPSSLEALKDILTQTGFSKISCKTGNYHHSARTQLIKQVRKGQLLSWYSFRQGLKLLYSPIFWLKKKMNPRDYEYEIFPREEQ